MGRPRKPTELLRLSGAYKNHPGRAADRVDEPIPHGELGNPPSFFTDEQLAVWDQIVRDCPPGVLKITDTFAVEMAVYAVLKVRRGDGSAADLAQAKAMLSQFGMTPSSRTTVAGTDADQGFNEFAQD
jgi:hypothetical protein